MIFMLSEYMDRESQSLLARYREILARISIYRSCTNILNFVYFQILDACIPYISLSVKFVL